MCFAPQRCALFRHRSFQKWSENGVFCTFWLGNVLRATTACTFSSLIWPAGSAPAALASLFFRPSGARNQWTNSVSRLSYLFAHLHLLSSDSFSSLIFSLLLFSLLLSLTLSISAFHLSVLSEVWLLNFLRIYNYCLVVGMMIQFDFHIVQRGRYTTNIYIYNYITLYFSIFTGN